MRCRFAIAVMVLLFAKEAAACSASNWDPNELVENEAVCSANGRFCAIVRWKEGVADFSSELAANIESTSRSTVTTAVYEGQRLLAQIPIERKAISDVLVSDSGRYIAAVLRPGSRGCWDQPDAEEALVTIYRTNGTLVGALKLGDVASEYDLVALSSSLNRLDFALRPESDTREVVVISAKGREERRIDLATAALLDEKRDLFPKPRPYITADDPALLTRVRTGPMPEYPMLALKARVSGIVFVDALVSADGDVISTQHSSLPFGLDRAADEAARQWKFKPWIVDGHPAQFTVRLAVHFPPRD